MTQEQTTSNDPLMVTIPQLTAMGILPGRAIRRLVDEGEIPFVVVGNRRYIDLASFKLFLRAGNNHHERGAKAVLRAVEEY
jgi:hypothetical protein